YSNLFSKLNARFGSTATWQREILRAAQSWAEQTNLNFDVVADNGTTIGQGAYQQGDPGMGDLRVGGYGFGNSNVATAFLPPPTNNYSIAGDTQFNTNQTWNIGSTYDLFTVAAHEIGHALGLYHSGAGTNVEMWSSYNGVKSTLRSDDIAGIQAAYGGARRPDVNDAILPNGSVATATDLASQVRADLTAAVTGLDITTRTDVDYYTFLAPAGTGSTLTVTIQTAGLSMLTPTVTVYAADGSTVLGSASAAGSLGGSTLTINVN